MFARLIAFVLTATLLWAGFDVAELPRASVATQEGGSAQEPADAKADKAPAETSGKAPGDKSSFPLDVQAQFESWNEPLGAPPRHQAARAAQQPDMRPQRIEQSAHLAPCLDGLLRPPCAGRVAA